MAFLERVKLWLLALFVTKKPGTKPMRRESRYKDVEEAGQWYFKRDILELLDEYMLCIKRMKKTDPDGYKLYSKLGAAIIPRRTLLYCKTTPRWKDRKLMPAFGAISILGEPEKWDWYHMKLGYIRRLDRVPATVEPSNGQLYEVTLFHTNVIDDRKFNKYSQNFFVSVKEDGTVRPLRYRHRKTYSIHHRDGDSRADKKKKGGAYTHRGYYAWTYGPFLNDLRMKDNGFMETVEEKAEVVFSMIATTFEHTSAALRVSARKKGITATWGVDLLRTPYFFDERDHTYTDSGHKHRIFHIVRTHPRVLKDGTTVYVKSHFRGKRKFEWGGYKIVISMPETHHADMLNANFGGHIYDEDEDTPPVKWMYEDEAAKIIGKRLRA